MEGSGASPKPLTTFHLFPFLPLEIRRAIYILATPPRVVLVEEKDGPGSEEWEDRIDEFRERCWTTFGPFNLHPEIACFAHNWHPKLYSSLFYYSQNRRSLEMYGFTTTQKTYQPWIPTDEVPEIPHGWLAEHPVAAFEMMRNSSLFSLAHIPAFLHVCSESREVLQSYGYQLSFGTRTDGPHTWFHFERDILFILLCTHDDNFLSGSAWDIGLFRVAELQRVKRLALQGAGHLEGEIHARKVSNMLRLLPNLDDLFLILDDFESVGGVYSYKPTTSKDHLMVINADEADFIPRSGEYYAYMAEMDIYHAMRRFIANGRAATNRRYFEFQASQFEDHLRTDHRKTVSSVPSLKTGLWKVPHVRIGHVGAVKDAEWFFNRRRQFWIRFLDTKRRLAWGRRSKREASKGKSNMVSKFQDVGEAVIRAYEPDIDERQMFDGLHQTHYEDIYGRDHFTLPASRREYWWLTEATVLPPRFEVY
ncbi:hypothetical protein M426DRAFT_321978 [Hypoxylon sp. CI-4A]|nr:hypothetical protein M426DRAFT_321978 [Hypoxylon sp. CI-4A]